MYWVAPRLVCGLGNRLFQMFAAIQAAQKLNSEAVFFLPRMTRTEHGNFSLLMKLFPTIRIVESALEWEEIDEGEIISQMSRPIVLKGFFQSSEFFPISHLPTLPEKLPTTSSWAVHFRLGDYRILPHHQVDLRSYYYNTITSNIPSNTNLILFSDSPSALPAISEELQTLGYSTHIYEGDTLETLKTFAACSGAVCGNSTFSWWASYFGNQQNKEFIAFFPDVWTKDPVKILDLPYIRTVKLCHLPAEPKLKSFTYI